MVKKKKIKSLLIGICKHCNKQLFNTDSFVSFADKRSAHFKCYKQNTEQQQENNYANGRKEEIQLF